NVVYAVLAEKKISFIGQPTISLTKLAPGNPLCFTITVSLVPDVTLPDYKAIASEHNKKAEPTPEVTEKEIETSLEQVRTLVGKQHGDQKPPELTDELVGKLG